MKHINQHSFSWITSLSLRNNHSKNNFNFITKYNEISWIADLELINELVMICYCWFWYRIVHFQRTPVMLLWCSTTCNLQANNNSNTGSYEWMIRIESDCLSRSEIGDEFTWIRQFMNKIASNDCWCYFLDEYVFYVLVAGHFSVFLLIAIIGVNIEIFRFVDFYRSISTDFDRSLSQWMLK